MVNIRIKVRTKFKASDFDHFVELLKRKTRARHLITNKIIKFIHERISIKRKSLFHVCFHNICNGMR